MKTTITPATLPVIRRHANAFRREIDSHGICHLIFDLPHSSANLFTRESLADLEKHLTEIAAMPDVEGLLIRSGKPRIFIAGADLHAMLRAGKNEIADMMATGQRVFNALEAMSIPTAAAIHGACLGGGYELALACDYRIASDDKSTRVGLPETQLGLLPAWGGSTRLPRLIGVRNACQAILKGTAFTPYLAKKLGLIDELVPAHCLQKHAVEWLLNPTNPRRHRNLDRLISPVIRAMARRHVQKTTYGNYPALPAAIDIVTRSPWSSVDESLAAERASFPTLVDNEGTRNLISLFFARERMKKMTVPGRPHPLTHVAIVGAGIMGCGIAYWLSTRGFPVLLMDVNADALAAADARLASSFKAAVARHLLSSTEAVGARDRITLSTNDAPLTRMDLVIEAAIEDPVIKRKLFSDLLRRVKPETMLATNTSAIPLAGLMNEPRLIGLHFFNPVHAMPLVEIIRPAHVGNDAIATAVQFVQEIGKLPIVVKDSPGFLVNRILMPYLLEAARMVYRGAGVGSVDEAMLRFGMPMGPLRLLDEVGLDVALHVVKTLASAFPDKICLPEWLEERVRSGALGVKSGHGYYRHTKGRKCVPVDGRKIEAAEVAAATARLPLLLTNEAAHCLDEGVVATAAEVDLGMVLGTGYAPFRGGPLHYANSLGLAAAVSALRDLETKYGPLYHPAAGLISRAEKSQPYQLEEP